jgi:hypothetical protein
MKTKIMNSTTPVTQCARLLAIVTLALAAAASPVTLAQTSVPTPQGVAPNFRLPQTASGANTLHYVEPRAGTWDFYATIGGNFHGNTNMRGRNVRIDRDNFVGGDIKMNFSDAFAFGFGLGYNITEQLSVHGQFGFSSPDYDGTLAVTDVTSAPDVNIGDQYRITGEADIFTGDLAVRYDFLPGKIRPYIQGSIGFMYVDTGIPNGQTYWVWDGGNWGWDGWGGWGGWYTSTPTVNHTYFTLGATAGLNYYFNDRVFAGLSCTANWANTPGKWMPNQRLGVSIGWNF